jgi:hypothetical protein
MSDFSQPSRTGLILGAAIVALQGVRNEYTLQARHFGNTDYASHPGYVEATRVMEALRHGQPVESSFERVVDVLAFVQQALRVSHDEWALCVPFNRE